MNYSTGYAIAAAVWLVVAMAPWATESYWQHWHNALSFGVAAFLALCSVQAAVASTVRREAVVTELIAALKEWAVYWSIHPAPDRGSLHGKMLAALAKAEASIPTNHT